MTVPKPMKVIDSYYCTIHDTFKKLCQVLARPNGEGWVFIMEHFDMQPLSLHIGDLENN